VLRTTEAAGDSPWIWWSLTGTVVVYAGLTIGAVVVLRSMARRWRDGEHDLPSPYGPEAT
jgi:cytochrome d ubiquinol oxidase subunit I